MNFPKTSPARKAEIRVDGQVEYDKETENTLFELTKNQY